MNSELNPVGSVMVPLPPWGLFAALLLACLSAPPPVLSAQPEPLPQISAEQLLARVAERAKQEKSKPPRREFVRTKTTMEFDKHQNVTEREELTYHMVIIHAALYPRLIRKNGRLLNAEEQKKEEEKETRFRSERAENFNKQEEEGNTVLLKISEDDAKRFDFSVAGREQVNGRSAWIVTVTPKSGLSAKTTEQEVMARVSGRLWIDEAESEITKLEVRLLKPVHFGFGFLAALNACEFCVTRNRLPDGEWENSLVKLALNFRVLLDTTRIQYEEKVSPLQPGQ